MKRSLCALLALLILFCGAQAQTEDIGRWTCRSVEYNGQSMSMLEFGAYVTLVLHEDGTFAMLNNGLHMQGTWTETDAGLSISDAEFGSLPISRRNGELIMEVMGRNLCLAPDNAVRTDVAAEELAGKWLLTSVYANGITYSQEEATALMGQQVEICLDSAFSGTIRRWSETEEYLFNAAFSAAEIGGIGTEFSIVESLDSGEVTGRFSAFLLEDGRLEILNAGDTALYFTKQAEENIAE